MSASDTRHSVNPSRSITASRISAPPTMTSSRPGHHARTGQAPGPVLGGQDAGTSGRTSVDGEHGVVDRGRGRRSARPCWSDDQGGDRPGQPDQPVACRGTAGGRPPPGRAGRRHHRPAAAASSAARRRVVAEEPLASAARSRAAGRRRPGRGRRGRRRPPARSTRRRCRAPGTGPSDGSRSATAPAMRQRAPPRRRSAARGRARWPRPPPRRNSSPLAASRAAEVATSRPRATPRSVHHPRGTRPRTATHRSMASGARRPVASTPSPSRVIRISRSRGRPSASATSSRVELVPQSMAAIARPRVPCGPCYHDAARATIARSRGPTSGRVEADPAGRPLPHRVVGPGQPPGQVGVEALDPLAGPAHPARGPGAGLVGGRSGRPARPRTRRGPRRSGRRAPSASAARTPPVDSSRLTASRRSGSHQPVAGGHRRAVVEERGVGDDRRRPVGGPHHHLEGAGRASGPRSSVATGAVARRSVRVRPASRRRAHFQNSSVEATRCQKPPAGRRSPRPAPWPWSGRRRPVDVPVGRRRGRAAPGRATCRAPATGDTSGWSAGSPVDGAPGGGGTVWPAAGRMS